MDKTGEKNKIKWIFEIFEKKSTAERWAFLYIKEKGRRKIKKNMMQIYKKKKEKKKKEYKTLGLSMTHRISIPLVSKMTRGINRRH